MKASATFSIILAIFLTAMAGYAAGVPVSNAGTAQQFTPAALGGTGVNLTIYANGSVSNQSLVTVGQNSYTLLGNLSGNLTVLASGITVYGSGYWVGGHSGITVLNATDVTLSGFGDNSSLGSSYLTAIAVDNLTLRNSQAGNPAQNTRIYVNSSSGMTFTGDAFNETHLNIASLAGVLAFSGDSFDGVSASFNHVQDITITGSSFSGHDSAFNIFGAGTVGISGDSGSFTLGGTTAPLFYVDGANTVAFSNISIYTEPSSSQWGIEVLNTVTVSLSDVALYNFYEYEFGQVGNITATHFDVLNATSYDAMDAWSVNSFVYANSTITSNGFQGIYVFQIQDLYMYGMNITAALPVDANTITHFSLLNSTLNVTPPYYYYYEWEALYTFEITNGLISGNTIYVSSSDSYAIFEDEFSNLSITKNIFISDYAGNDYGVYVEYVLASSITDNTFITAKGAQSFNYAVYLYETSNVMVSHNTVESGGIYGVYDIYGLSDSITSNSLGNSSLGVILEETTLDNVSFNAGNTLQSGIQLYSSSDNILFRNTFTNVSGAGILSYNSSCNVFAVNVISGDGALHNTGIADMNSSSDVFVSNSVVNFYVGFGALDSTGISLLSGSFQAGFSGLRLQNDTEMTVSGNTFSYYTNLLSLGGTLDNIAVYHNNFMNYNTTVQDAVNGTITLHDVVFDLGSTAGGNYWSGYTGHFVNGLGTAPYNLGMGLSDNYPLEKVWTNPTVTFVESGLAAGTPWSVVLGGTMYNSTMPSVTLPVTEGSYGYLYYDVAAVPGYSASPRSGTIQYSGSSNTVLLTFTQLKYPVTLTETGLSAGTAVPLVVGNQSYTLTGSVTVNLPNGTYSYSFTTPPGYTSSVNGGTFTVNGTALSVSLVFKAVSYTITFRETGLSGSFNWSVDLNGRLYNSTGTSVAISRVTSGTYAYTVTGPSGYNYTSAGNVSVQGNTTVLVDFVSSPAVQAAHSTSAALVEALIGGIAAGLVAMFLVAMFAPGAIETVRKKITPAHTGKSGSAEGKQQEQGKPGDGGQDKPSGEGTAGREKKE